MKFVRWNGSSYEEISGGGGSSHTHANLSVLNQITQALLNSWNTASAWVTTNGANVLSHIADSLLHVPSGGAVGQVLKKTASGTAWANESGGGGGAGLQYLGAWSVKTNTVADITPPSGATGFVLLVTYSSVRYAAFIPLGELTTSYTDFGISCSNTYVSVRLRKNGSIINMTRNSNTAYNITVYAI